MNDHYEAVILAAGRGSRLGQRTADIPKALLPIGPRSLTDPTPTCFLRRQCELLRRLGVERIYVVAGFLNHMICDAIAGWDVGAEVIINTEPDIRASGSLHSFQFAARSRHGILDGSRQTLLMDADIVYQLRALQALLDAPAQTSLLIHERYEPGDEPVLVYGATTPDGVTPRWIGKGLTGELVDGTRCLGEATGIVKFAPGDHRLVRATIDWMLGDPDAPVGSLRRRGFGPARRATEHEELTQRLMHDGRVTSVISAGELVFMECDTEADYALLRDQRYPQLLRADADADAARQEPRGA